ncbi:MAG: hypothetical protein WC915_02770 [archaeon]|jgi:paraquat-inducible protein B
MEQNEEMNARREQMMQIQKMMRRMNEDGFNIEGLKVENGKIIKEITKEEIDFMKKRIQDKLDNLTNEITNKEREIEETKNKIKEIEKQFQAFNNLIMQTKEKQE